MIFREELEMFQIVESAGTLDLLLHVAPHPSFSTLVGINDIQNHIIFCAQKTK